MNLWLGFLIGLKEIWAHKFRSFLTMLGVILGVASLLSMFSLTAGMAAGMREFMHQVGGLERVGVMTQDIPEEQVLLADISPGRTVADAEAILRSAPKVSRVTPVSELSFAAVTYGSETMRTSVSGCWPDYVEINKHMVEGGRNLTQLDQDEAHRVCVIGTGVVERLWPGKPGYQPLGETIQLNGRSFTVVGVFQHYESDDMRRMKEVAAKAAKEKEAAQPKPAAGVPGKGGKGGPRGGGGAKGASRGAPRPSGRMRGFGLYERKNGTIIIPLATMFLEFKSATVSGGVDQGPNRKLDGLYFQVKDVNHFQDAVDQVGGLLKQTHRGVEDFSFDTREEMFGTIEQSVRGARLSGGIIAGISLVVGGIGITNIMLASITERIREIGVRRAVGAKARDIFTQIVVESAVVGVIGGVLGLVASIGVIQILVLISPTENRPVVEASSVLVSFGFAVAIGVMSGLYPAFKASRIEPIEALRYG